MKKVLTVFILCIVFIIIYFLQINFFSWFTIYGVKPNLFVILTLFIGLYAGKKMGAIFGVIFGFAIDFTSSFLFGGSAFALGMIGFFRRIFGKEFFKR